MAPRKDSGGVSLAIRASLEALARLGDLMAPVQPQRSHVDLC